MDVPRFSSDVHSTPENRGAPIDASHTKQVSGVGPPFDELLEANHAPGLDGSDRHDDRLLSQREASRREASRREASRRVSSETRNDVAPEPQTLVQREPIPSGDVLAAHSVAGTEGPTKTAREIAVAAEASNSVDDAANGSVGPKLQAPLTPAEMPQPPHDKNAERGKDTVQEDVARSPADSANVSKSADSERHARNGVARGMPNTVGERVGAAPSPNNAHDPSDASTTNTAAAASLTDNEGQRSQKSVAPEHEAAPARAKHPIAMAPDSKTSKATIAVVEMQPAATSGLHDFHGSVSSEQATGSDLKLQTLGGSRAASNQELMSFETGFGAPPAPGQASATPVLDTRLATWVTGQANQLANQGADGPDIERSWQIRLDPPGTDVRVYLKQEDGKLSAAFVASDEQGASLLDARMAELRETLRSAGFEIESLDVQFEPANRDTADEQNSFRRKNLSPDPASEQEGNETDGGASPAALDAGDERKRPPPELPYVIDRIA